MASPTGGERAPPEIYGIDGFVVEAYEKISDVPWAEVPAVREAKTVEHELADELYGSCRTCLGQKGGEPMLLCDDCDRGFHLSCVMPALNDVPRGEWFCARCDRRRSSLAHRRAHAIAKLRAVMDDIQTRPSLPPRLRMKLLGCAPPAPRLPPLTELPPRARRKAKIFKKSREKRVKSIISLAKSILRHPGEHTAPLREAILQLDAPPPPVSLTVRPSCISNQDGTTPPPQVSIVVGQSIRTTSVHQGDEVVSAVPVLKSNLIGPRRAKGQFADMSDLDLG